MNKVTTDCREAARVCWENLEGWVRQRVQGYIQDLLEEEVTELLGRAKSRRRQAVDASPGYRNGYGKPRKLTLGGGTITVRRPRVRQLEERFESRILPLFARRTPAVNPPAAGCRSYTCTAWPRATSTWPCAACWARTPRCRQRRWPD